MPRTISYPDFDDLKGCIQMIDLRLFEHCDRDKNGSSEALDRARKEVQKALQIIARVEQQQQDCSV